MGNLMKMDFYRMFRSKAFIISNIVIFGLNIIGKLIELLLFNLSKNFVEESEQAEMVYDKTAELSSIFINPLWSQ